MDSIGKFLKNFKHISSYYEYLVEKTKKLEHVGITNEWLIDNYYVLVEHKNAFIQDKGAIRIKLRKSSRIDAALRKISLRENYHLDSNRIVKLLNDYQEKNDINFTYKEIDLIPVLLLLIYTERLDELCTFEKKRLEIEEKVGDIFEKYSDVDELLERLFPEDFDYENNATYIFCANKYLKEMGSKYNSVFVKLHKMLDKHDVNIKDVLSSEYQSRIEENILISNIISGYKEIFELDNEKLFENVSNSEKLLLKDDIYENVTRETKNLYRSRVIKLAKKSHKKEYDFVKGLMKNASSEKKHVGEYLFKERNNTLNTILYILFIFIISIVTDYLLTINFGNLRVFCFIVIFIPTLQLYCKIINYLATRFVRPKPLPKMDYSKGIPDSATTMIVIPTIIGNVSKVRDMYERLETFYLANHSDNLFFALAGDPTTSDKEIEEADSAVAKAGLDICQQLNKKYGKNIFYFIYRKRFYNPSEGSYLGYERKRGNLLQFNQVLLRKYNKKEMAKYFVAHNFGLFKTDIKYVITLDTDTELVLNTTLKMVGAMAHPLNKPVFNKDKTKVIKGYGLMQPRISVDVESTNKSLYSQIFASIGGFDTYNSIIPDFYQDIFREGSFIGKGIYDLKVFDTLMSDTIPDNLVLSHDLLEGNYLRCAYLADIELVDDFPNKFLSDATRQHRWARGDAQIISWLGSKVKDKNLNKVKNPLNLIEKWKIADNIIRMFYIPMLLITLTFGIFVSDYPLVWVLFSVLGIFIPALIYLKSKVNRKNKNFTKVYYTDVLAGGYSLIANAYIQLSTLPFYSKLYLDAFFRTMYRLFISHKNLLNWITAEEAEKTTKNDLKNYLRNFIFNIVTGILYIIVGLLTLNIYGIVFGVIFISAPFILWYVSQPLKTNREYELSDSEKEDLIDLARRTWAFFSDNLKEEYNYLIPDNYQENRDEKVDHRTSTTDISYGLVGIISAKELGFISLEESVNLLGHIIDTIERMPKWNGHLFNWYDVKTLDVLSPFVSTVDSGNFVASCIVVKEYLLDNGYSDLASRVEDIINNTDFKMLYTEKDVFSIGYDLNEAKLSIYNYNKFASESRLTSYVAIAKGDVPAKHWLCLDKNLTTYNHKKGLVSWSGTSFEYYMPYLYMKNFEHTLLDESYDFALMCQKEYMLKVDPNLPWGCSESAYDELDNSLNYKYKAFSTPYLKTKEEKDSRVVISPYSSLMAIQLYPREVYKNYLKFKKIDMLSDYGLYEAYDTHTNNQVRAYYAHHQGMSLVALTNLLCDGAIQNYFHENINVRTFEILLKEKIQVEANIDMKITKYKRYDYAKELVENDIRAFKYVSDMPEVSVLSNRKYCLLMNDRGDSFSRYRTIQLNRYRKVTEQDYGIFMYIKDVKSGYVWSNTYAPLNVKPDNYEVIFASDMIKYIRQDNDITTTTKIVVTRDHHAELRQVTFKNSSKEDKVLELTTYTEPILSPNTDDISHRVFNNMLITSYYDDDTNSLIAMKKSRRDDSTNTYMINRLLIDDPLEEFQYETDRYNFLGRNNNASNPEAINKTLSNMAGASIEPIMSLRNRILVEAGGEVSVCLVSGFGRSKEQLYDIIDAYHDDVSVKKAFEVASLGSITNTRAMNISGWQMRTYNIMLNYLYQTNKIAITGERKEALKRNPFGQNGLWKFGVSGDYPIVLCNIDDISDISFIMDLLKCFEYYKNNSIFVDFIIINSENSEYAHRIKKEVDDAKYRMYALNNFNHTPGSITIIDSADITEEDSRLLGIVPRLTFDLSEHKSLREMVDDMQRNNKIASSDTVSKENNIDIEVNCKLNFQNDFGGFNKNNEYIITNPNTPTPWSNVIANPKFGTVVTNNGCGFTWGYNSGEFKITSWNNDMVTNDKSEIFKFNGSIFDPTICKHGFGYSILASETNKLKHEIVEFVAHEDTVKLYLVKVTNKLNKEQKVDVSLAINPVFGNFEEKTARHILSEYIENDNYMKMRNVYSINFSNVTVFMSSSGKINHAIDNKVLVKEIGTSIVLEPGEEKDLVFMLGCSTSDKESLELIKKYNSVKSVNNELKVVKEKWHKDLSVISVNTPSDSFNNVMNGWYLYQALSSRIYARAGLYQVSGAYGFRDQLQDAMNIVMIKPELTRKQILFNASHQFKEGDVLHWWHEHNYFGLRSRYKDDFLWLVYATSEYINTTGDYSILDEQVPFVEGDLLKEYERERGLIFRYSSYKVSLLEHLELSIKFAMGNLGSHGLPLMGGGDWNDGMNKVGIKGSGESVWLGFFLHEMIDKYMQIMKKYSKGIDLSKYQEFNKELANNLNNNAWDGNYYLRAYFDNGHKMGSSECTECKIDLLAQSYSILSGVANKERTIKVLKAVEDNLVDKELGIIKLLTPGFEQSLDNPGYIMTYPVGIRENGGQYTHAVSWYLMALIKAGYSNTAFEYFQMINPINRTSDNEGVYRYKVEPYVLAADIYSASRYPARGGWTWYTGSAGWFYKVGIVDILGLNREGNKLKLNPNIPSKWKEFKVTYRYLDSVYELNYKVGRENKVVVDGKEESAMAFKLVNDGKLHKVKVTIKSGKSNI